MSRCFPYPPSGFEKNERSDQPDLLAKERHKEKKHKKDKERKEGKERKDKDKTKDKHKDKKDRKEKHKDKKRDKDRDKDKNKSSDDKRLEEQTDGHNEQKVPFSFPWSEEVKDSRFSEDLGRRIRDEEQGAAKRIFEHEEGLGPASVWERERANGKAAVAVIIRKEEHKDDVVVNIAASIQERERANGKPIVTNFTNKEHHRADGVASTATALRMESHNGNQMVPNFASKKQRKGETIDCVAQPLEKINSSHEVLPQLSVEKGNDNHQVFPRLSVEKGNDNHQVFSRLSVDKRNDNHQLLPQLSMEKGSNNHQVLFRLSVEKGSNNHQVLPRLSMEKGSNNHQFVPRLSMEKGSNNHQVLPRLSVEKGSTNHQFLPRLSMEKGSNNHQVLPRLSVEKGNDNHQVLPPVPMGKDAVKRFQGEEKARIREMDDGNGEKARERDQEDKTKGKDKIKDREKKREKGKTDDKKGHRHKDRDQEKKKSKGKDKNRNKEKGKGKEEKKSVEGEIKHKGHDRPKDIGESSQPDSREIKPLAPHIPNGFLLDRQNSNPLVAPQLNSEHSGGNDVHSKKRKHIETNGFLNVFYHAVAEDAVRSNKALEPGFSLQQPLENGKRLEMSQLPSYPSMLHVTPNNFKEEKAINRKEHKINGITQAQPCPIDSRPPLAMESGKSRAVSRPPHPDSKYLSQVYSVPQMEEWPATDDQEWLLGSSNPHPKPVAESEAIEPPRVWARGLQIEMADVFALPYVIPY